MKIFTTQISSMTMLLALPFWVSAQVFHGDLILRTQAEVDAFHYTEVTGSLTIGNPESGAPSSDITSLKPLSSLKKVGYSPFEIEYISKISSISATSVLILNNDMLPDLRGLENLESLSLIVMNNGGLKSFHGLENYTRFGDLVVIGNHKLQDFRGLENVHTIFDNLIIADNNTLTSLHGLDNLSLLDNNLIIIGNEQLQDLQGLENLSRIGVIDLKDTKLQHLKGLKNLSLVFDFSIKDNEALISLQGLENLTTIDGSLTVINNNQLSNLKGLEKLQSLENLEITGNPNLNDCCDLADIISKVKATVLMSNGPSCNSVEAIQDDCFFITHFTLVDAVTNQDIYDLNNDGTPAVINISEVGDQLNIKVNPGGNRVKSVVFELNGEVVRTENVAPYTLAGDDPPGDYFSWTPLLGRYTLTAIPYEAENATGKQAVPLSIDLLVTDQPFAVTHFTLIATVDQSDQLTLKEGTFIKLGNYYYTGLNIRANTTGNVGSVVFDLNEIKNYSTENEPPFSLGGNDPAGNYYEVREIKEEGFFKLTATPYAMPNGKGTTGTPLIITFKTSVYNITENHIVDFVLIDADVDEEIMVIHDGSTLDLRKLAATSFNIRAVTQVEEIPGGRVVFDYDGQANFRTERAAPYALGGDIHGDYNSFPLPAGQHTLKGTVFPEYSPDFYARSITFEVVNNQEPSARKSNNTSTFSKDVIEEELTNNFSEALQKVIVYPNPAERILSIKLPDTTQAVSLYLYNAQGHQVMETSRGSESSLTLDISHLAAGMYVLKVASDQSTEMHRILLK